MSENGAPRKRLDQRVAPGWASVSANVLRGAGFLVALFVLWLGFLTGGFFLLLTGVLAAIALVGGWLLARLILRESWYERPIAKPLSIALVVAFPVGLLVFAQLAGPLLTPPPRTAACFAGELGRGEDDVHTLPVDPRLSAMKFSISVPELEGGALRWWATDPAGDIQWGGRAESPGFGQTEELQPESGQWSITILSEAARVSYEVGWAGVEQRADLPADFECPLIRPTPD